MQSSRNDIQIESYRDLTKISEVQEEHYNSICPLTERHDTENCSEQTNEAKISGNVTKDKIK